MAIRISNQQPVESISDQEEGATFQNHRAHNFVQYGDVVTGEDTISKLVVRGMSKINQRQRNGRLYASDAGFCARQTALQADRDEYEVQTAATTAYYAIGVTIEDLVLNGLYESGALLFKGYKLPDIGLNLGGYIDAIVFLNGRIRVLEVKSCGQLPSVPKPTQAAQAMVYSAITGLPATLLYFSRSVANFKGELMLKEFPLPESDTQKRMTLYQVAYGHLAFMNKVIPAIPAHVTSKAQCGFCPFTGICWDGEEIKKWRHVDPDTHLRLVNEANELVDILMDPAAVNDRRTGILKHLSRAGNSKAKELLRNTDWSRFF